MGLGKLAYRFYFKPLGRLRTIRQQGLVRSARIASGEHQMRKAGRALPTLPQSQLPPPEDATRVTFLTGDAYWWQTVWCAQTLLHHAGQPLALEIVDDGSLKSAQQAELVRLFPQAEIVSNRAVEATLRETLPEVEHPHIWHYRRVKPIFRKLSDVFGRDDRWRLLLDSDMLFFARPEALLEWLNRPTRPVYMLDVHDAYGYTLPLMERLTGGPNPSKVNIGIFGFSGGRVDWSKVERWIEELVSTEGLRYNLTQALSAMLMVGSTCEVLPAEDYLLLPNADQAQAPSGPLQHYVAESKEWYFRYAWKEAARLLSQAPAND